MKITYKNEFEDLVEWQLHHFNNSPALQRNIKIQKWTSSLVLLFIIIVINIRIEEPVLTISGFVFIGIYFIIFNTWTKYSLISNIKKSLKEGKNKGALNDHTLEITDNFLVETTDIGEQKVKWNGVERVCSTDTATFIYIGSVSAHVIPKNRIIEGDYETFVKTVRDKIE